MSVCFDFDVNDRGREFTHDNNIAFANFPIRLGINNIGRCLVNLFLFSYLFLFLYQFKTAFLIYAPKLLLQILPLDN